jgi:mono/diheme cytochrome c family protein
MLLRTLIPYSICFLAVTMGALRADETQTLPQLSVETAQRLAKENSGRLSLDELKTLSPEVAKVLAKHEGWLSLNGLTEISDEAAAALGQHKGDLHLNGLVRISDATAAGLAGVRGELSLNGLTAISDESARALAKHSGGRLMLKGLTTLSTEAAQAFAGRKGGGPFQATFLDGLTSLTPEGAAALAQAHGHNWRGELPAFKTLPVEVARALAKRQGHLSMPGLTTISDEAAKALGGKLSGNLPRLTSLTVESAKAIAGPIPGQFHLTLHLDGLTALPDEIALSIGGKDSRGNLHLNGLKSLNPIAAKAICQREGDLYLNGLTTISNESLRALAEHQAPGIARPIVYLQGLTAISDDGAAILAAWPKWSGEFPALATLTEEVAKALAASRRWDGKLPAVKTISVESAQALAQRNGNLALDGLTTLTDDVAAALAKQRGGTLSLNGLTSLSDKAIAALAQYEGRLSLGGLTTLSSGAAQSLAGYGGDWLLLDGLKTLDDAAATALAQRKGVVSLLGLKSASDDSLDALLSNPQVLVGSRLPNPKRQQAAAVQEQMVRSFLQKHCADCHDGGAKEGEFTLDRLAKDDVAGRVAFATIFERLRAGDMPPPSEPRPPAREVEQVVLWIQAKLDSPLPAPPTYYAVREKPIDGNRLPNAILFGGPRGPSVPPPPRLWRLSPSAYTKWTGEFNSSANGLQQPFGVIQETGIRDFAALYSPDEGATGLLLTNAELIVAGQTRGNSLVNVNEKPEAAKENLWPNESRVKAATAAEQETLKSGLRVRGGSGAFAPLLHPQVKATREELEKAIRGQYRTALARPASEQELASVIALYDAIAADGDYSIAGKTVLMAPLMTPEAILRFEVGLGSEIRPGVRSLSPRETALAISLALSTKRDPGLLSAAAEGKLTTREEVAASVRRILDDPKISKPLVLGFFREYFDYYRAPEVFKDPLPDYMTRRGVHHNPRGSVDDTDVLVFRILSRDEDVLKELLTTTESFATHELFGPSADGLRSGEALFRSFGPYALDHRRPSSERIGVLMQPSWHVAWSTNFHNDIVRRGRWVREHLLGGRVPDLPINAAAMVPDDPHRTLRQRQMATRADECWKCHSKMDELGLPFEDLDHYAMFRRGEQVLDLEATAQVIEKSKDKNQKIYREAPLDTTGTIAYSGDPSIDGPVRDAPEMLRRLANSNRVRQVFIRHAFRYFLGRNETPGDAVSLQEAEKAYLENGGSFKALLVSLLSSESFLYRTQPAQEKQ